MEEVSNELENGSCTMFVVPMRSAGWWDREGPFDSKTAMAEHLSPSPPL